MPVRIAALGREGPPGKISEGEYRFVCPHRGEQRVTVNPRNNLAHSFCRQKDGNNIDLLILLGYDSREAVVLLERRLTQYERRPWRQQTRRPASSAAGNRERRLDLCRAGSDGDSCLAERPWKTMQHEVETPTDVTLQFGHGGEAVENRADVLAVQPRIGTSIRPRR